MKQLYISNEKQKPTLHIDGKEVPPVLYALSDFPAARAGTAYAQKNIARFAEAGVNLVAVDVALHRGWKRVSPFDPQPLLSELYYALRANPNAKLFLRCHLNPPYWWLRDNPDECVIYRTEEGDKPGIDDGEYDRLIQDDFNAHMRVSLASKKWMREAGEKLELFLEALKRSPEGKSVAAVQVACGIYGEWHQWGIDVGKPMCERFRDFLRETYGTEDALREAWHQPTVTFDTADFRPEYFRPADDGCYRDPAKAQDTADAQRCVQLTTAEAILFFAKRVKKIVPDVLCGCFYGYYLGTGGVRMPTEGHLDIDMIFNARGTVDFLCGPFAYKANRISNGVPMQRALLESFRLHDMLWITEMDARPEGVEQFPSGDPSRMDETLAVLYKETLKPLLGGMGFWYYDHRVVPFLVQDGYEQSPSTSIYRKDGWWEREESMRTIEKIQRLAQRITAQQYCSAADVLLVYDTDSHYYRQNIVDVDDGEYEFHEILCRMGVTFDCVYLKDLALCDLDRYRSVIFTDCNMVTPEKRAEVLSLLGDKNAIFLAGYGYCDGKTLSAENIVKATGICVEKADDAAQFVVNESGETAEVPAELRPLMQITDPDAKPLARYENGTVAAAEKDGKTYVSLHTLPPTLAKSLLAKAGVHFWCDSGEPVSTGFGMAVLHCQKAGTRAFRFPSGNEVSVSTDGFDTKIFDIETETEIVL